jgi:hypothetical protein
LDLATLELLMAGVGLEFRNICVEALRSLVAHEGSASMSARFARHMPEALLWRLRGICPTHVYLLHRKASS